MHRPVQSGNSTTRPTELVDVGRQPGRLRQPPPGMLLQHGRSLLLTRGTGMVEQRGRRGRDGLGRWGLVRPALPSPLLLRLLLSVFQCRGHKLQRWIELKELQGRRRGGQNGAKWRKGEGTAGMLVAGCPRLVEKLDWLRRSRAAGQAGAPAGNYPAASLQGACSTYKEALPPDPPDSAPPPSLARLQGRRAGERPGARRWRRQSPCASPGRPPRAGSEVLRGRRAAAPATLAGCKQGEVGHGAAEG